MILGQSTNINNLRGANNASSVSTVNGYSNHVASSSSYQLPFDPWPVNDLEVDVGGIPLSSSSMPPSMLSSVQPSFICVQSVPWNDQRSRQAEVEVLNEQDEVEEVLSPMIQNQQTEEISRSAVPQAYQFQPPISVASFPHQTIFRSYQHQHHDYATVSMMSSVPSEVEATPTVATMSEIPSMLGQGQGLLNIVSQDITVISSLSSSMVLDPSLMPYYASGHSSNESDEVEDENGAIASAASSLDGSLTPSLLLMEDSTASELDLPVAATVGEDVSHMMDIEEQEVEEAVSNLVLLSNGIHSIGRPNEEPIPFSVGIDEEQQGVDVKEVESVLVEDVDEMVQEESERRELKDQVEIDASSSSSGLLLLPPIDDTDAMKDSDGGEMRLEEMVVVESLRSPPSSPVNDIPSISESENKDGSNRRGKRRYQRRKSSSSSSEGSSGGMSIESSARREGLRSAKKRLKDIISSTASSQPTASLSQSQTLFPIASPSPSPSVEGKGRRNKATAPLLPESSRYMSCDEVRERLRQLIEGENENEAEEVGHTNQNKKKRKRAGGEGPGMTQKEALLHIGYPMDPTSTSTGPQQTLQRFLRLSGGTAGASNPVYLHALKYFQTQGQQQAQEKEKVQRDDIEGGVEKGRGERKKKREMAEDPMSDGIDVGMEKVPSGVGDANKHKRDKKKKQIQVLLPNNCEENDKEMLSIGPMSLPMSMSPSCVSHGGAATTTDRLGKRQSSVVGETAALVTTMPDVASPEKKMPLLEDLLHDMALSFSVAENGTRSHDQLRKIETMKIYDNCDEVRQKINKFLQDYSCSIPRFAQYLGMTTTALTSFLSKFGPENGTSLSAYERAYYFFEKYRLYFDHKKSSKRLQRERNYPEGFPHGKHHG